MDTRFLGLIQLNKTPVLFNTQTPYTVKEGLSFWVNNTYRNYLVGITTVPEFIGEYMPQQTHFDSLFHLLFYKKEVIERYLVNLHSDIQEIIDNSNRIHNPAELIKSSFVADIEVGLNTLRKWYLIKDEFNFGDVDPTHDYKNTLQTLKLVKKDEDLANLTKSKPTVVYESENDDGDNFIFWSTTSTHKPTQYKNIVQSETKSQDNPPPFLKNIESASGNKYKAKIRKVSTIKIGSVTKSVYRGFDGQHSFDFSYTLNQPFKVMLEIPVNSYTIVLKTKEKSLVPSVLLDDVFPECVASGYFYKNATVAGYEETGAEWIDVGSLAYTSSVVQKKSTGESKVVFIDQKTAQLLGGDQTVLYAEITPVEYLYCHSLFGVKGQSIGSHTHNAQVPHIPGGYLRGSIVKHNQECAGSWTSNPFKNVYYYSPTWNFDNDDYRVDGAYSSGPMTSSRGGLTMSMAGTERDYGSPTGIGSIKSTENYVKCTNLSSGRGTLAHMYRNHVTRYKKTRFISDYMYQVEDTYKYASTGSISPNTNPKYHISNVEIELSIYDLKGVIGYELWEDAVNSSVVDTIS